jgi:hypothetical protein
MPADMIVASLTLLVASGVFSLTAEDKTPQKADEVEQKHKEWEETLTLLLKLPEQTGNTDGYPESAEGRYNIHEHEPAKSIIALGPKCIPELRKWSNSATLTKAHWFGRTGEYTLRVSDIVVCILREIGGKEELAALERHKQLLNKIWHDARDYKDAQKEWTDDEKAAYMGRFEDCNAGMVITEWAIDHMKARLGLKDENAEKKF